MQMNLDIKLFYKINHLLHNKALDWSASFIHYLTYSGWIFALPVIFYFFSNDPVEKLFAKKLALSMILAGVLNDLVIQLLVTRPRPFAVLNDVITVGGLPTGYSFPSGHTAIVFAFVAAYFLAAPKNAISYLLLLGALVVGFSRIYMGFHYPSDVIAGALLGIFCALLSVNILRLL